MSNNDLSPNLSPSPGERGQIPNASPHQPIPPWLGILIVAGIALASGYAIWSRSQDFGLSPGDSDVFCTQEAMLCPDGSAVGRTGPACEFAACPEVDETASWKIYRNEKYGFEVKYPLYSQVITGEVSPFYIYIKGGEYPAGAYVAVEVIPNPLNLPLDKLGSQEFTSSGGEVYDLDWKSTKFNGLDAITAKYPPPGDSGEQTIYLFTKNGINYGVWSSSVDELSSSNFKDLAIQILSTFKFIEP